MNTDSIVNGLLKLQEQFPSVGVWLILAAFDIAIGTLAALITKTVSSTISSEGMLRKVVKLLIIGLAGVIGHAYKYPAPLAEMTATFFILPELWSIMENCRRAGVPLPPMLADVLIKLKKDKTPPPPEPPSMVHINHLSHAEIHTTDGTNPNPVAGTPADPNSSTATPGPSTQVTKVPGGSSIIIKGGSKPNG